jgi:hypothetical protein
MGPGRRHAQADFEYRAVDSGRRDVSAKSAGQFSGSYGTFSWSMILSEKPTTTFPDQWSYGIRVVEFTER